MDNKPGSRKPISLDLELCYSGFEIDELEYIDYNRTVAELEAENEQSLVPVANESVKKDKGFETIEEEEEGDCVDGILSECDFEEYGNCSVEEFRSYLCSTPTRGRKHRGSFPQENEISGFNLMENTTERRFASSIKQDSGIHTRSLSRSRYSFGSFFGDNCSVPGSIDEDLNSTSSSNGNIPEHVRRKIELDSDVHDPYSNVDELDISIEEELAHMSQATTSTTFGSLRRRLSLKVIRRNLSTGLFGSYQQRSSDAAALPSTSTTSSQQLISQDLNGLKTNQRNTGGGGPNGPLNVFFRKFRNRHFI